MAGRGDRLISAQAGATRSHSSGQLGAALRSVLLTPRAGFEEILRSLRRRTQTTGRIPEGAAPYLLATLGGSAAMLFWLKIGALLGFRQVAAAQFRWSYLVLAALAGATIAVVAQVLWGYVSALVARVMGAGCPPHELRVVWGASAFPQVLVLVLLLPLDLLIVGPATFTSERLTDPLSTGWAALSIAFAASLGVWSAFILFRGVEVALGTSWIKTLVIVLLAGVSLVAVAFAISAGARAVAGA